jgi:hypothetical protein
MYMNKLCFNTTQRQKNLLLNPVLKVLAFHTYTTHEDTYGYTARTECIQDKDV